MKNLSKVEFITLLIAVVLVAGAGYLLSRDSINQLRANNSIGSNNNNQTNTIPMTDTSYTSGSDSTNTESGPNISGDQNVEIYDLKVGTGAEATSGSSVTVHYIGTFTNGTKFDASRDHGQPFTFTLGAGSVINGWDIGIQGMKVGGKRKLVVKPAYGYGPRDYGPIPGNSTLLFEVELLGVK